MRYVYITLLVAVTVAVVAFSLQNLASTTISFFSASITLPLSLIVLLSYGLGMLSGGSLVSVLRSWLRSAGKGSRY